MCVNTKKEVKFWNRGRNLKRSADGKKYCYAPNLSCYLLRTSLSQFKKVHFYGEITVTLLWHLKAPVFMQQLAPSETKILLVLRDPVERYIALPDFPGHVSPEFMRGEHDARAQEVRRGGLHRLVERRERQADLEVRPHLFVEFTLRCWPTTRGRS